MVFSSKKIIKYAVMGMISILQVNALEKPNSINSFEREKAIHDCWAIKQFTDKQFPADFPNELMDMIAQTVLEFRDPLCPMFQTPEDIKKFEDAISSPECFNNVKVWITLDEKKYILDKSEELLILSENNIKSACKYSAYDIIIKNIDFVDSRLMCNPKRIQYFYNISGINQNNFNIYKYDEISFKNFKMTILIK